jgi:hypothetical protein
VRKSSTIRKVNEDIFLKENHALKEGYGEEAAIHCSARIKMQS